MADPFREIVQETRQWSAAQYAAGWLDDAALARFDRVEQASPGDLFVDEQQRPLVIAFFGGTGVGKSSLLNRLAGETIARTGVERPTSHEVTLFVHRDVALAELPADLPVDRVRVERHASPEHRQIAWIDAPDIDSTETENRQAALAWLPHVDLVCYVVSPERYRDDVGWRVLRDRGHRHGWMFVMNRWDEGAPQQRDDFAGMLNEAGFERPLLYCTSCLDATRRPEDDQFDEIRATIAALLEDHAVRELTRLGHRARLNELRSALRASEPSFGTDEVWATLVEDAQGRWREVSATILEGAEWSLRSTSRRFAANDASVLEHLKRAITTRGKDDAGEEADEQTGRAHEALSTLTDQLWDEWAQSKLVGWLDQVELRGRRAEISVAPLRRGAEGVVADAGAVVAQHLRDEIRLALARPGGILRRVLRRVTGFLMSFLPVLALLWVAFKVVEGYYYAGKSDAAFLGTPFAIHSVLLVLVSWAVPFTVDRLLKPSMDRIVLQALRRGLTRGLESVGARLVSVIEEQHQAACVARERLRGFLKTLSGLLVKPLDARAEHVGRLIAAKPKPHETPAGG